LLLVLLSKPQTSYSHEANNYFIALFNEKRIRNLPSHKESHLHIVISKKFNLIKKLTNMRASFELTSAPPVKTAAYL
jgi:hypothetical protein